MQNNMGEPRLKKNTDREKIDPEKKPGSDQAKPRLIVASDNAGKLAEYTAIFADFTVIGMREAGFNGVIEETGGTYKENAEIKAMAVFEALGGLVIGDDSGLSVDLLDGAPGLYSARFAGIESVYDDKFEALWQLLKPYDPSKWTASFLAVLCVILPDGEKHFFEGKVEGLILTEKRGRAGFGYDPVFYLPELHMTAAELSPEQKNVYSHRGRAAGTARAMLLNLLAARPEKLKDVPQKENGQVPAGQPAREAKG